MYLEIQSGHPRNIAKSFHEMDQDVYDHLSNTIAILDQVW